MRTAIVRLSVLTVGALVLLGQGCKPTPTTPSQPGTFTKPKPVAASLGFGKLPKLALLEASPAQAPAPEGAAAAPGITAPSAARSSEAAGADAKIMGPSASGVAPSVVRPVPAPKPRPATIEYFIEGQMPTWGSEGEVLLAKKQLPDTTTVGKFAQQAGLPAEVTGSIAGVTSLNFQWKDRDGFIWTYDAANRTASFYKETSDGAEDQRIKPLFDEAESLKIANDFLDAHGFSAIRKREGKVQDLPQFLPLMKGAEETKEAMPCIQEGGSGVESAGVGRGGVGLAVAEPAVGIAVPDKPQPPATGNAAPAIYPSPCWWPIQATVTYPGEREGRKIADSYGADMNTTSLAVDLRTKQVVNGYIQLDENMERSSYPLIDEAAARRRLQSGGRNPVWPWGNETGNIKVRLKTLKLVWMRHDAWLNGTSDTYYLPGLRATGSVERGEGMEPEEYRTIVPLLADDAFEDAAPPAPAPLPMGDVKTLPVPEKK